MSALSKTTLIPPPPYCMPKRCPAQGPQVGRVPPDAPKPDCPLTKVCVLIFQRGRKRNQGSYPNSGHASDVKCIVLV